MKVWPLEYPQEVMLVVFAVVAAVFLFYKLTFLPVAALGAKSVQVVYRLVTKVESAGAQSAPAESKPGPAGTPGA